MKVHHRSVSCRQLSWRTQVLLIIVASLPAFSYSDQRAFRRSNKQDPILAPDQASYFSGEFDAGVEATPPADHILSSEYGFVEIFKKLFGGKAEEEDEAPTTSEQRRSSWHEEERHAEFAFCSDVGFRGLHPDEGGEEA